MYRITKKKFANICLVVRDFSDESGEYDLRWEWEHLRSEELNWLVAVVKSWCLVMALENPCEEIRCRLCICVWCGLHDYGPLALARCSPIGSRTRTDGGAVTSPPGVCVGGEGWWRHHIGEAATPSLARATGGAVLWKKTRGRLMAYWLKGGGGS